MQNPMFRRAFAAGLLALFAMPILAQESTPDPAATEPVLPTLALTPEATPESTPASTPEATVESTVEATVEATAETTAESTDLAATAAPVPTGSAATAAPVPTGSAATAEAGASLTLTVLGTYAGGSYGEGASEIVAYHAPTQQLYVVNGEATTVDILNIADPAAPELVSQIDITPYGEGLTHVTVYEDLIAVAIENGQEPGAVAFFQPDGAFIASVGVGALPDMLTFTPDGRYVLTANEGEPSDDYADDPEGSVTIIDVSELPDTVSVFPISFADVPLPDDVRIYGPNATQAQDLEPEYIAISPDGMTAYVTLQENNAVAVIDIEGRAVTEIRALGFKDHSLPENALDASNEDGAINITTHPVFGMYQPDAIQALEVGGVTYLFTANEGDTRDYEDSFSEEAEVAELTLDPNAFPNAEELQAEENTGKLEVTNANGDVDGDGDYDVLYVPGGRSFSVWNADTGELVFDSGSQLEEITAEQYPDDFNANNEENGSFDDRSDNKGPEPEGLVIGAIGDSTYAFIGLENIGGVIVYDVTNPTAPVFVTYVNNRDFSGDAEAGTAGDLGPEGLLFIPAATSPTGEALVVVANEISGTTTIYSVTQ